MCGESVFTKCYGVRQVVKSVESRLSPSVWCEVGRKECGESVDTKCVGVR